MNRSRKIVCAGGCGVQLDPYRYIGKTPKCKLCSTLQMLTKGIFPVTRMKIEVNR